MKIYYSDTFVLPLPSGHRFPMEKYAALRREILAQGVPPEALHLPDPASIEELCRAHAPDYVARVLAGQITQQEIRSIGFPWTPEMVERSRRSAGATLAACRTALDEGCGINLAGGTHHAHAAFGAGFCVFNDAAVAARAMQAEGRAGRIAVVDCDVHQGDGTATILAGDSSVFTLSLHGAKNFPFNKARSDLDVELPDGTGDSDYLAALDDALTQVMEQSDPELVIYLAGADPYQGDRLGRLNISFDGLAARDLRVLGLCRAHNIPVAIAMAGGYARNIDDTVAIHARTVAIARQLFG